MKAKSLFGVASMTLAVLLCCEFIGAQQPTCYTLVQLDCEQCLEDVTGFCINPASAQWAPCEVAGCDEDLCECEAIVHLKAGSINMYTQAAAGKTGYDYLRDAGTQEPITLDCAEFENCLDECELDECSWDGNPAVVLYCFSYVLTGNICPPPS